MLLEKIKAFYRKKYSGFWDDLKNPKYKPLYFGAIFLLSSDYFKGKITDRLREKYNNDADYAERYRDFFGEPSYFHISLSVVFALIFICCIIRMRAKSKRDESIWPEMVVTVCTSAVATAILLFSLYL